MLLAVFLAVAFLLLQRTMTAPRLTRSVVKSILSVETPEGMGATVRRSIGTDKLRNFTPFLMLDHFRVGPGAGFPDHPHRGMTTVTLMLNGSFRHEDVMGNKGRIDKGGLQFMVAGKGVLHAEMPVHDEGAEDPVGLQLWIDLPAESKLCPPSYQELNASEIPSTTHGEGVEIKVICGEAEDLEGNVTKSPVKPLGGCWYFDVTVQNGKEVWQKIPSGWNAFIYTLEGGISVAGSAVKPFHTAILSAKDGESGVKITSTSDEQARFVIIAGEPLEQEIVQYGPMVMDSVQGIRQAFADYQNGVNGFEGAREWKSEIGGQ